MSLETQVAVIVQAEDWSGLEALASTNEPEEVIALLVAPGTVPGSSQPAIAELLAKLGATDAGPTIVGWLRGSGRDARWGTHNDRILASLRQLGGDALVAPLIKVMEASSYRSFQLKILHLLKQLGVGDRFSDLEAEARSAEDAYIEEEILFQGLAASDGKDDADPYM